MALPPQPSLDAPTFECPWCRVVSSQDWWLLRNAPPRHGEPTGDEIKRATCASCGRSSLWVGEHQAWPRPVHGPPAPTDLPGELVGLYEEARVVAAASPRSAAALLRSALHELVQGLTVDHQAGPASIAELTERLRSRGLITTATAEAVLAVRELGDDTVRMGLVARGSGEDASTVEALFHLVHVVVDTAITTPLVMARLVGGPAGPPVEPAVHDEPHRSEPSADDEVEIDLTETADAADPAERWVGDVV